MGITAQRNGPPGGRRAAARALAAAVVLAMAVVAGTALLLPPRAEAGGPGGPPPGKGTAPSAEGASRSGAAAGDPPAAKPPAEKTSAAKASATRPRPSAPCGGGARVTGVVNLNRASESELDLLPGVGPAKAQRIVAWRNANGPFRRLRDLRRVKGFGRKTVVKLTPFLTLDGPTTATAKSAR